jgi:hypothetical protein
VACGGFADGGSGVDFRRLFGLPVLVAALPVLLVLLSFRRRDCSFGVAFDEFVVGAFPSALVDVDSIGVRFELELDCAVVRLEFEVFSPILAASNFIFNSLCCLC